jgi:hypothetical protein
MQLAALQQTPAFKRLSVKAKMFVAGYVGSYESLGAPDAVFATRSAYQNDGENARKMSYAVLKNKKVAACLQVWRDYGKSKRALFLEDLEREMNVAADGSAKRNRLVQLYGQTAFGIKIPETRKPSEKIKEEKVMNNSDPMNPSTKNLTGKWNRSSAFSPKILAILTGAITASIQIAIENFTRAADFESLTPEQQVEAGQLLANSVTTEFAAYVERLKAQYGSALQGRS